MARVTEYDEIAGCFKILPDKSVNFVQELGALENKIDAIRLTIKDVNENRLSREEAYINIEMIMEG